MALRDWVIYARTGALLDRGILGASADLGSLAALGASDHVDMLGWSSRAYVAATNGITTPIVFTVEGSHDGNEWGTLVLGYDGTGTAVTSKSVAAATTDFVFLDPRAIPRFVRVNVTTANANGTQFDVGVERE